MQFILFIIIISGNKINVVKQRLKNKINQSFNGNK